MRGLRFAARAAARRRHGPATLGGLMDRAGTEDYATLWYGEYRPASGTLTYSSAGNPPPALHTQNGVVLLAEANAPSLGTGMTHSAATGSTVVLPPGAVLIAYSDGLIERRGTAFDKHPRRHQGAEPGGAAAVG
jgi:serine phosphatase RsbU (regulator of sigma subunit)